MGNGIAPGESNESIAWDGIEVTIGEDGTGKIEFDLCNGRAHLKADIGRRLVPQTTYVTVEREWYSFGDVGAPRLRQVPVGETWDRKPEIVTA